jgi:hypothetical protein
VLINCLIYSLVLADVDGLALWPWCGLVPCDYDVMMRVTKAMF